MDRTFSLSPGVLTVLFVALCLGLGKPNLIRSYKLSVLTVRGIKKYLRERLFESPSLFFLLFFFKKNPLRSHERKQNVGERSVRVFLTQWGVFQPWGTSHLQ